MNKLLNVHEAAEALRISERNLFTLTKSKQIVCVRIGSRVCYDPDDLKTFIDQRKYPAQSDMIDHTCESSDVTKEHDE
jgi:excisionase family DNA binding protein